MSVLSNIRTKVRRLTGRPSPQQITDVQIDEYVNTFYLYDLPEHLRLFNLKTTFQFMTEPNVDQYDLKTMQVWTGSQNVNAIDYYVNVMPPGYIAGYQSFWSQDREQFFRAYPALAQISSTVTGDGTAGPYSLTFTDIPVLQNQVTVGAIDSTGANVNVIDVPTNRTTGTWQQINTNTAVTGSISYITGVATITFSNTIPSGNEVTFTAVPYAANRPQAMLYYNDVFTLRPVPDKQYLVKMNAYQRPTQFLEGGVGTQAPRMAQWWQCLAYGAAKKIFEDSQDPEGAQIIKEEFENQLAFVERRAIVERTQQRTATIYTEMTGFPYGNQQNRF